MSRPRPPNLRRFNRRKEEYFALRGGLNLVDPPISLPPGGLLAGVNYEPKIRGGYGRIGGFERFDGRPAPSDADYWILDFTGGVAAISVGDTITGATSGATGVVILDAVISSGAYGTSDAVGYIVFTKLAGGPFTDLENIQVSAVTKSVADGVGGINSAAVTSDHQDWRFLAAENYRTDILVVPGSGKIRGVHVFNGDKYAFRDNAGATAVDMYKATSAGWVQQTFGNLIYFTTGTAEFLEGETLTGGTSAATATINRVVLQSGTWGSTAAGYLVIGAVTGGPFGAAEAITSAAGAATSSGAESAITLPAGGRYEFINHNFYGHTKTQRSYGVNGVGPAFEWDGTVLAPIYTGMSTDTPNHIEVHRNHLFLAFPGGSLQNSATGLPLSWSVILGATEIAVGDEITSIRTVVDDAMAVVTRNRTFMLYGLDNTDWDLKGTTRNTGGIEWTYQDLGKPRYLDDRGIVELSAALEYGNFLDATITDKIQPLLDSKRTLALSSTIVRTKNQYRLFFSDNTGLILTFSRHRLVGITTIDYGMTVEVIDSHEDATGTEVLYFGSTDGYIYQADKGTSFDGSAIVAWLILPYYNYKTPSYTKQFRKITPEFEAGPSATILVQTDFSYGDPNIPTQAVIDILGGGGSWNVDNWGSFLWSSQVVSTGHLRIKGQGNNMGLYFYSSTDREDAHTFHGITTQYSLRGLER